MTLRSDDIHEIPKAINSAHAKDISRRIQDWKVTLKRVYPDSSDADILRLAIAYVADEELHPDWGKDGPK